MTTRYFITAAYCGGPRGIFCDQQGRGAMPRDDGPHTEDRMYETLGHFALILDPKSESFTERTIRPNHRFHALAEYSHQWGIAYTDEGWAEYLHWLTHPAEEVSDGA